MKLETFFEKFDQFADAPDAVAKMRELVLLLAFQGGVVGQDATDESGHELLKRIVNNRERLIANREIKCSKVRISSKNGVQPKLPNSWCQTTLGVIGDWGSGSTPKRGNPEFYDGDITWFKSGELNDCETLSVSSETITQAALESGSFRRNQVGDVLIAMYGATIGKVAILAKPAVTNQAVCGCTPFVGVINRFLFYYLLSQKNNFHAASEGGAQPNISKEKLLAYPFPLPPLAEQKRIVAKVDELMALCDQLEVQQQERDTRRAALARASLARFADAPTPANLNFLFHKSYDISPADLRKSILTLAVQGKLVPQDPNDEPAENALKTIEKDRAAAVKSKKMRKLKVIEPYEGRLPFDSPTNWVWSQIGLLVAAEDNAMCDGPFGSKLKTSHYIDKKGFAVIRLGNIGIGQFIWGKEGYISESHFKSLAGNHTRQGDLIVAGMAEPLIRCCEVPPTLGPAINKADCFRLRLHETVERAYVLHFLNSPVAKSLAAEENHGMTRQRINLGNAKALPIPFPPLAEQQRIVAKVDQLMALVDELETQLAASRTTAKNLLEALVAELTAVGAPSRREDA